MKVLITGSNGQVGLELQQTKPHNVELFSFNSNELDITDMERVNYLMSKIKPDIVINAAAYTAVDKAEDEPERAYLVNAHGAENLAIACNSYNSRLMHISTDFVFNGQTDSPLMVADRPDPLNVYGASKLEGEHLIQAVLNNSVIIRTSWVYSIYGSNFVKTMIRLFSEKPEVSVISDQFGSPTSANGLALYLWYLTSVAHPRSVINYTDVGGISWFDFAKAIQKIGYEIGLLKTKCPLNPILAKDFVSRANRPEYSVLHLEQSLLASEFSSSWEVNLKHMLVRLYKANYAL